MVGPGAVRRVRAVLDAPAVDVFIREPYLAGPGECEAAQRARRRRQTAYVLFLAPGARRLCLAERENAPALEPHLLVALPQPAVARDGNVHRFYFRPRHLELHLRRALGGVEQREAAARLLHCLIFQCPRVQIVVAAVDHGLLSRFARSTRFALFAGQGLNAPAPQAETATARSRSKGVHGTSFGRGCSRCVFVSRVGEC